MRRVLRLVKAGVTELRDIRRLRARIRELEVELAARGSSSPKLGSIPVGDFLPKGGLRPLRSDEEEVRDAFLRKWYAAWGDRGTVDISWFGHRTLKCAFDLMIYQEILCELRPDFIIETGTRFGGSAYYLASLCQLLGHGQVITIDIDTKPQRPVHPLITYISGSSTDPQVVQQVADRVGQGTAIVILDSDHREPHVRGELEAYQRFVQPGSYLVVEDSCVNGNPIVPDFGPGPMEAMEWFLARNDAFERDLDRERFWVTLNPNGFLKRVK